MPHHYAAETAVYKVAKRHQVNRIENTIRVVYSRQRLVTVNRSVAMSGKMFANRHYSAIFEPLRISTSESRHPLRVLAERAIADNRIGRIGIDIKHRSQIHMNANLATFARHLPAILIQQLRVGNGSESHTVWKTRGIAETH